MPKNPGFDVDLARLERELATQFPNLHLVEEGGRPLIRGSLCWISNSQELARFSVLIDLEPLERRQLPVVREIGGRIPWTKNRHVNDDGSACVCLPDDYLLNNPGPFDVMTFLKGPILSFFAAQALVERGEPWPFGEWGHGDEGRVDWLKGFLASLSPTQWRAYLSLLAIPALKGHHPCPCGSGLRLRACHRLFVERLRSSVTPRAARKLIESNVAR